MHRITQLTELDSVTVTRTVYLSARARVRWATLRYRESGPLLQFGLILQLGHEYFYVITP